MLTLLGFLIGTALIAYGIMTGKAPVDIFLNWQGLAIVIGGTIASTFVSFPVREVLLAFRSYIVIFVAGSHDYVGAVNKMVSAIRTYQRDGLEHLQREAAAFKKLWIFRDGVQMMANGYSKEEAYEILEDQIRWQMQREMKQHQLFGTMAKFAPAFGMIGTLIGLVQMLKTMEDPSQIGAGMATALLTTFYGAVIANFLALPLASKLKNRTETEILTKELIIEGILSIQSGDNPRVVEQKLKAFISPKLRESISVQER